MLNRKLLLFGGIFLAAGLVFGQTPQAPSNAEMAKKIETTCTGYCHGPSLIAQQRLDRNGWTRELDKMIRWGANVPPADKDLFIAYLARTFSVNRPLPNSFKAVPAGKGSDVFQLACLACHDDRLVTSRRLDKAGWTRQVDEMIKLGAFVPTARKDDLIEYLTTNWGR
jgi:hypothetical protein